MTNKHKKQVYEVKFKGDINAVYIAMASPAFVRAIPEYEIVEESSSHIDVIVIGE